MANSTVSHAIVPTTHWAACRRAERRREDFRFALDELGDLLDGISDAVSAAEEDRAGLHTALIEHISQCCALAESELHELWRLLEEDAP